MCCLLVSGFLTEITQQIHSLRASGVISSHFARAIASEVMTFRKSAGTLCTAPGEIAFLLMISFYIACAAALPFSPLSLGCDIFLSLFFRFSWAPLRANSRARRHS